MLTEFGGSQVEVQRCSLSSEGPRLRSSGAQVEVQQCPLRAEVGVDAKVVEEKLGEREMQRRDERRRMRRDEEEEAEEENNCDKILQPSPGR